MSWEGVTVMDQRVRFIGEYLEGYFPFSELGDQLASAGKPVINGLAAMKSKALTV